MIITCVILFLATAGEVRGVEYTGAVVEYVISVDESKNAWDNMMDNMKRYKNIINGLPAEVDIIVFPENGLCGNFKSEDIQSVIPEPSWSMPDLSYSPVLSELSNAAKQSKVYIVVNLVEKAGQKRYNTNVVFRKNGTIAARYRKFNLFVEDVDRPSKPDAVWFDTEMGVRFGTFTCFDILFEKPALELVNQGIRDFIFPTHWFSELPFLTAGQAQRGWSWSTGSNLLASGVCEVVRGSTGSGLYSDPSLRPDSQIGPNKTYTLGTKDETVVIIRKMTSPGPAKSEVTKPSEHLIKSTVHPTNVEKKPYDGNLKLLGEDMKAFKISELEPKDSEDTICATSKLSDGTQILHCNTSRTVCHKKLCCKFQVTLMHRTGECPIPSDNPNDFWLFPKSLTAFSGVRDYGGAATGGMDICGIVTCPNNNCTEAPSHRHTLPPKYKDLQLCTFEVEKVQIEANFPSEQGFVFPSVLSGQPNSTSLFGSVANDGEAKVVWKNNHLMIEKANNLGTGAILRRVFSRDGQKPTEPDSASIQVPSTVIITFTAILIVMFQRFLTM